MHLQNVLLLGHCKRGSLHDAFSLFASMQSMDLYAWNMLMSANNRLRNGLGVLQLFSHMQREATIPNKFIFSSILSACAAQADVCSGKRIHARIAGAGEGFCSDVVIQTALVNMYGRFGDLDVSCRLFHDNPRPDPALWNGMLTIYYQNGHDMDCWRLYNHMLQLCVMHNEITLVVMLSISSDNAAIADGKKLHVCILALGSESHIVVGTALVNMYSKCRRLNIAEDIFARMLWRDLITWNAMIAGCALNMEHRAVLQLYAQMKQEGVMPSEATFTSILNTCTNSNLLTEGKLMHACMMGSMLGIAAAALVNMYGRCGDLDEARHHFKEQDHRSTLLWNTMISMFAKKGMNQKTWSLYKEMKKVGIVPDEVTFVSILSTFMTEVQLIQGRQVHNHAICIGLDQVIGVANALINMYGRCSCTLEDCFAVFSKLSCPDIVTFVNMISSCADQAILTEGCRIDSLIEDTKMEKNIVLANAILSMYGKCGSLVKAERLFDKMIEKNVVSWSTMIATYAQHGEAMKALKVYEQMHLISNTPDPIVVASILSACTFAGFMDEGYCSFSFIASNTILVNLDHFNCMIDLLGKTGCLDEAELLINNMPFQPSNLSWSILVCAHQIHLRLYHAKHASEFAIEIDPDDITGYVILSKIYEVLDYVQDAEEDSTFAWAL